MRIQLTWDDICNTAVIINLKTAIALTYTGRSFNDIKTHINKFNYIKAFIDTRNMHMFCPMHIYRKPRPARDI